VSRREWKPGDVGVCSADGVRVVKANGSNDLWHHPDYANPQSLTATSVRPLVVIDPAKNPHRAGTAEWADWIEDRYVEQTKPPKPDEPTGLGAVVEDAEGKRWVRLPDPPDADWNLDKPWRGGPGFGVRRNWQIVAAVCVLSEGIS